MNITTPWEVDLDGRYMERNGIVMIEYVGKARRQLDGTYRVLAKLFGGTGISGPALCLVEVKLTF